MNAAIDREIRILKVHATASTAAIVALCVLGFTSADDPTTFEVITVERINVVESDGGLRLVISNSARQHPGIVDDEEVPRSSPRPPGILFFNHRGDEAGGLIAGANGRPDGTGHFVSLTMDKSRSDQTIAIQHLESDAGDYWAGLVINDQPEHSLHETRRLYEEADAIEDTDEREAAIKALADSGEFGTQRLAFGKGRDGSASVMLADPLGRPRIKLQVTADGTPSLQFLDGDGEVTHAVP